MTGVDSFEQLLIDFTNMIVPKALEIPQSILSPSPSSIPQAVAPFISLLALNCLSLAVVIMAGKLCLTLIESFISLLRWGISASCAVVRWGSRVIFKSKAQPHSFDREYREKTKTRIIEDAEEFEAWERIARQGSASDLREDLSPEAIEALAVLGVSASATEAEIRKAYLSLMKIYHPDLFMSAPKRHQEMMGQRVLRIRDAYDTITRELNQIEQ